MADVDVVSVGDPVAVRELAKQIRQRATLIDETPSGAASALGEAIFEGKAADRLRTTVTDARRQVSDAAKVLQEIASSLDRDADTIERTNRHNAEVAEAQREAQATAAKAKASSKQADDANTALGGTVTPASAPEGAA